MNSLNFLNNSSFINKIGLKRNLSFSGAVDGGNLYDNFRSDIKNAYGQKPTEKVLREVVQNDDNLIGEGSSKLVYQIPYVDNYVVAKLKDQKSCNNPIKPAEDDLPKYNFGQSIATNGQDILVMAKVRGDSYSLPGWSARYYENDSGEKEISTAEAKEFLAEIQEIADFPLSSYVKLAKQINYLSQNNIRIDAFNPNNVLIDREDKEMNYIDIPYRQEIFKHFPNPVNSMHDMVNLLCDTLLNISYSKALDKEDASKLKEATNEVIEKCKQAAKITGLDDDSLNLVTNCVLLDKNGKEVNENALLNYYSDFLDEYGEKIYS